MEACRSTGRRPARPEAEVHRGAREVGERLAGERLAGERLAGARRRAHPQSAAGHPCFLTSLTFSFASSWMSTRAALANTSRVYARAESHMIDIPHIHSAQQNNICTENFMQIGRKNAATPPSIDTKSSAVPGHAPQRFWT